MLTGGYSWRLYFYVVLAFALALFILALFFVEETSYDREAAIAAETALSERLDSHEKPTTAHGEIRIDQSTQEHIHARKSYLQTLSLKGRLDPDVPIFTTMIRSFTYFLVPQALWVITTYGINIGLGAFALSFTFPIKMVQPPYNWDIVSMPVVESLDSVKLLNTYRRVRDCSPLPGPSVTCWPSRLLPAPTALPHTIREGTMGSARRRCVSACFSCPC